MGKIARAQTSWARPSPWPAPLGKTGAMPGNNHSLTTASAIGLPKSYRCLISPAQRAEPRSFYLTVTLSSTPSSLMMSPVLISVKAKVHAEDLAVNVNVTLLNSKLEALIALPSATSK